MAFQYERVPALSRSKEINEIVAWAGSSDRGEVSRLVFALPSTQRRAFLQATVIQELSTFELVALVRWWDTNDFKAHPESSIMTFT